MSNPDTYQIAVTVFTTVPASDARDGLDAANIAETAIEQALRSIAGDPTGEQFAVPADFNHRPAATATVHLVLETRNATDNGCLAIQPTATAFEEAP